MSAVLELLGLNQMHMKLLECRACEVSSADVISCNLGSEEMRGQLLDQLNPNRLLLLSGWSFLHNCVVGKQSL